MIDERSIQEVLKSKGDYKGQIDGDYGAQSKKAAKDTIVRLKPEAKLWPEKRIRVAIDQFVMRDVGIAAGEIDGFVGPDTLFGYEAWQNMLRDVEPAEADVAHQPATWPRQKDVPTYYGEKGKNWVPLVLPYPMKLAWDVGEKVTRIQVHEKVRASAFTAFSAIKDAYGVGLIEQLGLDLFGGSGNVRKMRGSSTTWSMHSWAIAIDFDPSHNQLRWGRDKARMSGARYAKFLDIWEAQGWISLGRERNYDWMHVQAARL